jgi:tetratricopeptide (TPR) repeat protein
MNRASIYLIILLSVKTGQGFAQPKPPPAVEQKLHDAKAAQQKGEHDKALKILQDVHQHAREHGLKTTEGQALIRQGQVLQESAKRDPAKRPALEKQAEGAYRAALQVNDQRTKFQAQNNLGVLYFRQGNTAAAINVFKETKLEADVQPREKANFYYNFGHVLEKQQPNQALQKYEQALQLNPEHRLAAEGAFRVLLNPAAKPDAEHDEDKYVVQAVKLADTFVKQGNSDVAVRAIGKRLESDRPTARAQELLAVLVRSYAERGVTPEQFRRSEWAKLQRMQQTQPQLKRAIDDIHTAYQGDFPTLLRRTEVRQFFPSWIETESLRTSFGSLLQSLGNWYALQPEEKKKPGDNERALKYYAATWLLDPQSTRAAVRTAALFRNYR